jgi:hypothetical protein
MSGCAYAEDAWLDALEDALDPGFHGVRTPWIPGFMAFQLARRRGDYRYQPDSVTPVFAGTPERTTDYPRTTHGLPPAAGRRL